MDKDQFRNRLRRIEGQVRGLQRMVDEDTYCIDVLTQIASVTKALQGVGMGLLDQHIHHCVQQAAEQAGGRRVTPSSTPRSTRSWLRCPDAAHLTAAPISPGPTVPPCTSA